MLLEQISSFRNESILERTSGLIGEYRFDGTLEDSSLSYNDGTHTGTASYVTDVTSITAPANKHKLRLRLNSNDVNFSSFYRGYALQIKCRIRYSNWR